MSMDRMISEDNLRQN